MERVESIDHYIAGFPPELQQLLTQLRTTIQAAAPMAQEKISYQMPTYFFHGNLVHFAAYKKHIGFYPTSSGIASFQQELNRYKNAKGSVQFPLDRSLPLDLITRIVQFRVRENQEKAMLKKTLRICPHGHRYYKSSDCPTCPLCESNKTGGAFSFLSAPAQRALGNAGVHTFIQLAGYTEREVLQLHGMGKSSLPKMRAALENAGLSFKKEKI